MEKLTKKYLERFLSFQLRVSSVFAPKTIVFAIFAATLHRSDLLNWAVGQMFVTLSVAYLFADMLIKHDENHPFKGVTLDSFRVHLGLAVTGLFSMYLQGGEHQELAYAAWCVMLIAVVFYLQFEAKKTKRSFDALVMHLSFRGVALMVGPVMPGLSFWFGLSGWWCFCSAATAIAIVIVIMSIDVKEDLRRQTQTLLNSLVGVNTPAEKTLSSYGRWASTFIIGNAIAQFLGLTFAGIVEKGGHNYFSSLCYCCMDWLFMHLPFGLSIKAIK